MYWYLKVLRQYADFDGRARRKEYWMFYLINSLIFIAIELLNYRYFTLNIIVIIYSIALVIPTLAVTVRRLHDINKSGIWYFISWIPIIGSIWLFFLTIEKSDPMQNEFGPNPIYSESYT